MVAPLGIRLSPFVTVQSGSPYDVVLGRDIYGNTLKNARPTFATASCGNADATAFGDFCTNPIPGSTDELVPRNYLTGAGLISFNVRVARTFGFGPRRGGGNAMTPAVAAIWAEARRSRRHGGPGGGGPAAGRRRTRRPGWRRRYAHGSRRRRPWRHGGGGDLTEHRFNLTLSVMFNNLINHFNPGGFVGNLNSPQFGQPTSINSGFGGGPGAAAVSAAASPTIAASSSKRASRSEVMQA